MSSSIDMINTHIAYFFTIYYFQGVFSRINYKNFCILLFINVSADSHKSQFHCLSAEMGITIPCTEEEAGNLTEIKMTEGGIISIVQQSQKQYSWISRTRGAQSIQDHSNMAGCLGKHVPLDSISLHWIISPVPFDIN